jgi:hypothetical protein
MCMLQWIYGNIRRDRVWNNDIRERLGVTPVEKKLMQHYLRWFGHIQQRSTEAPVHSRVIRRSSNEKTDRWWSNLIWKESVKRDLNDWCIIKELALDRREWKLVIYAPKSWSSIPSFLLFSVKVFSPSLFVFFLSVLLSFLLSSN